jgi:Flp pilus assembly protein TadD
MKAVELNPDFGEAHLNLAFELLDFNDNQSALKHFQTAARLLTNNVIAQINCGIAYARAGRFNEAALYFEKALQLDPHDPQVHYNLGLLYVKMGQRDKAVIELSRTLDLDPNHREAKALLEKITPKL